MLAFATVLALYVTPLGFDGPGANVQAQYRTLNEAAAHDRETNLPWQTFRKFAPEFLRLAEEAPESPTAIAALLAVGEYGSQCIDTCKYDWKNHASLMVRALELIAGDRLADERVGRLCLVLSRLPSPAARVVSPTSCSGGEGSRSAGPRLPRPGGIIEDEAGLRRVARPVEPRSRLGESRGDLGQRLPCPPAGLRPRRSPRRSGESSPPGHRGVPEHRLRPRDRRDPRVAHNR